MRYISELIHEDRIMQRGKKSILLKSGSLPCGLKSRIMFSKFPRICKEGNKVNILALGDVGGTVLLGLKLLGGVTVDTIGIYDLNEKLLSRYEREINQIYFPDGRKLPQVEILEESSLFDCNMFVFCASKGVPPIGTAGDVRMSQLEANSQLVELYAGRAAECSFEGIFAVVSDPVDPLCKAAVTAGLKEEQVQGYGLGVMNARAAYFASQSSEFASFHDEGRAFGPHGEDLVIANSLEHYDDCLSRTLTRLTVNSNMDTRADGFKPYIAPAISSGAISLLETLKGGWNYSSVYLGKGAEGAFLGCRNRRKNGLIEIEDLPLDNTLYERIEHAYNNLKQIALR